MRERLRRFVQAARCFLELHEWGEVRLEATKRFICSPYREGVQDHIWRPWSQCKHCPVFTLFR